MPNKKGNINLSLEFILFIVIKKIKINKLFVKINHHKNIHEKITVYEKNDFVEIFEFTNTYNVFQ
jgi:hypothetical protein